MANPSGSKSIYENKTVLIILSITVSVLVWFIVAYSIDTSTTQTVRNIPVTIDVENTALAKLGLEPVVLANYAVDVEVFGSRATVGNVKASDIEVLANLSNINAPGTYNLNLVGLDKNGHGFEIRSTIPETVSVRFDFFTEKTLEVDLELSGLEIAEGYILTQEYIYPDTIDIKGPATEMDKVSSSKARLEFDKPLSQTGTYKSRIILQDMNGDSFESPYISADVSQASITLPILKKKTVPVSIDFINVPQYFNIGTLSYTIEPDAVEIAGPVPSINGFMEIHLGYIDLRILKPDTMLINPVKLPPGYMSVNNVQEVSVIFNPKDLGEKLLNITDIRLINQPLNSKVTIQTKTIYGVTVYGPSNELELLTSKDLVAQIDMADVDSKTGSMVVPVTVLLPNSEQCWAYGDNHTAVVLIERHDG
jgi:YbbR domain-containing protein